MDNKCHTASTYQTRGLNSAPLKHNTGHHLLYHNASQDVAWVCTGGFRESNLHPQMCRSGSGFSEGFPHILATYPRNTASFWSSHMGLTCALFALLIRDQCMNCSCLWRSVCCHEVPATSDVQDSPRRGCQPLGFLVLFLFLHNPVSFFSIHHHPCDAGFDFSLLSFFLCFFFLTSLGV